MDTLNQQSNVSAEDDKVLRREVENAFQAEAHPTPCSILMDRLLLQAEATPQLGVAHASELQDEHALAAMETASTREQENSSILARFFNATDESTTPVQQRLRQLRDVNWELYHEYLEQNLNCTNATSGVNF